MIDSSQTSVDLLAAVVAIQRQFIAEADPEQAFEQALRLFVDLSESQLGFLGEVLCTPRDEPYLKIYAVSGIAWNEAVQGIYDEHAPAGMEFHNLENLIGAVITSREAVVANSPDSDPRSGGLPPGIPPLRAFLGLPIFGESSELVGVAGLANRPGGYDDNEVVRLQPLCDALGVMIVATQRERQRRAAEESLRVSEDRYRSYIDHATDGIFLHDRSGRIIDVNRQGCESLGYELEELIGKMPAEFDAIVSPELVLEFSNRLDAGETVTFDSRHRRKDGSTFPVEICIRPYWVNGERQGLAMVRDVSKRAQAEEALREQYAILQTILESTTDFVYMKDCQGRYVTINPAAAAAVGKPVAEFIGRDDSAFFPPAVAREIREREQRLIDEGAAESFEETIPLGDQLRHLFTAKSVCRDSSGKVIGIVGITRDVTAHVRAEEALREAQRRLAITLKGADVGIWDWDLLTNEVDFSDEWKSQLGYAKHEVANNNMEWQSRVHPDDLEPALNNVRNAIDKRTSEYRSEFRLRHKNGSWRWILSLGSVIDGPDGKAARMLGVHVDITDRKQAEQALLASEARYRTFVDHASDALFLQDHSGRVVDVNTQACASLGYKREELIGTTPPDFDPDVSAESVAEVMIQLDKGEVLSFDSHHRRKDGSIFPVEIRLRPFWENGERQHIALVRDITERKQAEEALRESEARLRTLLENLDKVAVQAYEAEGTITFWNKASEIFYGYTAANALGHDVVELLHGEATRDAERRIMAEAMRTGKTPAAEEIEVVRRDGSKITVFASRIVHPRPGKPPEFFRFDVDVTERKRAEEELAIRQAELLHASRLTTVGQMVAELSHEVAQPLNAIGNFAAASERILDVAADPSMRTLHEYVRAILKQNERCVAILERLRDFSRRTSASRSGCDIGELLRDSVELIANELRRNHVSVRIQVAEELPMVWGDRVQLQQVIVNLLTNARDAVCDQQPERRLITVRSSAVEDAVIFEVDDLGCGISEEIAAHLFDPFFTTKEHGMGIGLSICQSIMKDHGGRIEACSNQEGGATFRVRLPLSGKRST